MLNFRVLLVEGESVIFLRRGNMWTPEIRGNKCGKYFVRVTVMIGVLTFRSVI
jgi:hypothetical protein